jgi:hypothetical protein
MFGPKENTLILTIITVQAVDEQKKQSMVSPLLENRLKVRFEVINNMYEKVQLWRLTKNKIILTVSGVVIRHMAKQELFFCVNRL